MSFDSFNLGSSKLSAKKTPFYKHEDPSKLNYYARFSPKRKMLNQQFQQDSWERGSSLSPRTSKASSSQKRQPKSKARKVFKDQAEQTSQNKFQLIDPKILISVNDASKNRGQIYIDDNEEPFQDNYNNQKANLKSDTLTLNNSHEPRFNYSKNILDIPIYQNPKESSESQESQSFERMIQPSSSQDNDIPYVLNLKKSGGQMLIEEDQDQDLQTQKSPKRFKAQSPVKILDGSQKKILQLAKSIGAHKQDATQKKQVRSQNVSFSVDSDLSLMQQKWNSYFQSGHQDQTLQNQQSKRQIFSENLIQQRRDHDNGHQNFEENQRKIQSSSEEQLPSFSHPDTSSYHITPLQSQRSSTCSQDAYNLIDFQGNNQAKQFKRQFTFGNQLNAAFQDNTNQLQQKTESKQPLFKKFLQKSTLENFKNQNSQKKQKQKNLANQSKVSYFIDSKKPIISDKKILRKSLILNQKSKINGPQIIPIAPQSPEVYQINQDQKMLQASQSYYSQSKKGTQILIIQEQLQQKENNENFSYIKIETSQVTEKQIQPLKTIFEKSQKRMKWQQTLRKNDKKQKNRKQSLTQSQKQHKVPEISGSQIKIDDPSQSQENDSLNDHQKEIYEKVNKNIEPNSYSKIFSQKRFYRMRKGSYNDRVKISQSQYHSSEEEQNSQKDNKYSQPKSQDGESLTTATQQVHQNTHISPHYFFKNKSNCIQEVENLKKYLQRIQNSPISEKQKTIKRGTFDFNENFQSDGNENDSKNQSLEISYLEQSLCVNEREQQKSQKVRQIQSKTNQQITNKILPQSYQPRNTINPFSDQQKQTPIKLIQKQSDIENKPLKQKNLTIEEDLPLENYRSFQKSLTMLEQIIPNEPNELSRIYEKIYTQVYEQELKYQQKLQKQEFLINLMGNFLQAQKQKIDCQNFLTQQLETNRTQKTDNISQSQKDQNDLQILINKHIILALVRNLVHN